MDKYQALRDAGTNGANYDLGTDDIIAHLRTWDAEYGITLSDVRYDAVNVRFDKLPSDISPLAADIYEFCPDTIDQHYGIMAELTEVIQEIRPDFATDLEELMQGVDLTDEDYGMELLKRDLVKRGQISLGWD